MKKKRAYISFGDFFLIWAQMQGWNVPDFHLRICDWLERLGRKSVLKVFRGGAKSTILAVYQAWKLRDQQGYRFLDRSADDGTAIKLSADTKHILEKHPLCRGMIKGKKGVERFSIEGHNDIRNASVTAYGIMSNATSSRADEIINDDTEVPKNIQTPDTRRTLRDRLGEETHIIVPGGKILYVGTDHTHNSIYDEKIKDGYGNLIIPLFSKSMRAISDGHTTVFRLNFSVKNTDELYVMAGIGRYARVLETWQYEVEPGDSGTVVRLDAAVEEGNIFDFASGNVWLDRFNRAEILFRRQECKTLNAWDSQYMLKARPVHEIRLDPDRINVYSETPAIRFANEEVSMLLGSQILTGCRAVWDCSLGKADSDDSAFAIMFQDMRGHLYWHVLDVLKGDPFEQCRRVAGRVEELQIPGVTVLTRGVGGFLPAILNRVLKEQRVSCGVREKIEKQNKSDKILGAFEPLLAAGILHAHTSVIEALAEQMRDWIPGKQNQPDDFLDAGSESIIDLPVKIGKVVKFAGPLRERREWREYSGTYEVQTSF